MEQESSHCKAVRLHNAEQDRHGRIQLDIRPRYRTVAVNVAFGVPQKTGPVAVTVTAPGLDGSVSVTLAEPLALVLTMRSLSVPALAVNSRSTPPALAPDEPGWKVAVSVTLLPGAAD